MRRQATGWEKIFAKDTTDEGLGSKICKESLKLNNKADNLIKNVKDPTRHLTKGDIYMANKHMQICSTWYLIRKMQNKCKEMPLRNHDKGQTPQSSDDTRCW